MRYVDFTPKPKYYLIWTIDKYGFVDFYLEPSTRG
jgi:hypothetical protein